jgi:hypothetical protein
MAKPVPAFENTLMMLLYCLLGVKKMAMSTTATSY